MPLKLHREQFRWTNGRGHDQKPVLYAMKSNTNGLGKKQHDTDQWWAKAFDNQLKSLDVSNSASGDVTVHQTEAATPLTMSIASRYYIRFVRGGLLTGGLETPTDDSATVTPVSSEDEKKRRKEKRKQEKSAGKAKKRKAELSNETREERKERKRLKRMVEKEMAALGSNS